MKQFFIMTILMTIITVQCLQTDLRLADNTSKKYEGLLRIFNYSNDYILS